MQGTDWSDETVLVRKDRGARASDETIRVRTVRFGRDRAGPLDSTAPVRRFEDSRGMMIAGAIALLLLSAGSGLVLAFVL